MSDKKLVHVVDDEEAVRNSLDFLLRSAGYVVELWSDGTSFLDGADGRQPACVLLDLRMPDMDGLDVQRQMVEHGLALPVIILTGHGDVAHAVQAMKAGASDFLEKPFDRDKLLLAIEAAFAQLAGQDQLREQRDRAHAQISNLTAREHEVLEGLACGYPNKTIAYDLGISTRTVEVYRANVMAKLDVHNFADALRIAFAAGMGSEPEWRRNHGLTEK